MAPRKKNPLDDAAKTVGNWLGGAARVYADITDRSRDVQPGRAARVQAALDATRAIGKVVDTATGGFGAAVVSDAQRMAKTGSSTPSALYKTAAVNLAAAAAGVGAAKVAGKAAGNASNVLGKSLKTTTIAEQFPRLNKKQLALLKEIEKGGPDIAKTVHRAAKSGDVASVLEDVPRFSKLKSSDVSAVADRLARQSQSSLRDAGFGDTIKVWRTESANPANVPDRIVSVTTQKGGIATVSYTHLTLPTNREV